jgi:hypothetical protein
VCERECGMASTTSFKTLRFWHCCATDRVDSDRLLIDALTPQQSAILRWHLGGWNDGEIATRLGIPRRTANFRTQRVFSFLESTIESVSHEGRLACLDRVCAGDDPSLGADGPTR